MYNCTYGKRGKIMAHSESIKISAHPNLYNGKSGRELRIDFSLPTQGTNSETGIVVFVPGFGGNVDSKVYKKMRETFADQYNLITMQCDYFGNRFMQGAKNISIDQSKVKEILSSDEFALVADKKATILELITNKELTIQVAEDLQEDLDEFNDMGFMQAIDIITAIEALKIILVDNHIEFDTKRLIGYGHSHGAFLLHLCNKMYEPFSFIIDNSAWIEPLYLHENRQLFNRFENSKLLIEFDYIAKDIIKNKDNLNLFEIYKGFENKAQILTFQGTDDNLVDYQEKKKLINNLSNADYILITESDVDNIKYKSHKHGLDADFLELFSYALSFEKNASNELVDKRKNFAIGDLEFILDTSQGLPIFDIN